MLGHKINVTYPTGECHSVSIRDPHSQRTTVCAFAVAGDQLHVTLEDGTEVVYNLGDMAWVIAATALVWIMIPGVGFFYSGLLRRKNAASMLWQSMVVLAVVSFQVRDIRAHLEPGAMLLKSAGRSAVVLLGLLSDFQRRRQQIHWRPA